MQGHTIRDILHSAAAAASMPDRFLHPSQLVRYGKPRPRWRKPLLSAAAALMACLVIVMVMPGAQALGKELAKGFVTMWTDTLGKTKASVVWTNPADLEALRATGQSRPMEAGTEYRSMDEAAAAAGFQPVATRHADARLIGVGVQIHDSAASRFVYASATYLVGTDSVSVVTEANLTGSDGNWQVLPYHALRTGDGQTEPMTEIRKLTLGSTEAVAYNQATSIGTTTVISWLQDGVMVHVRGLNAEVVQEVATATAP